MKEVTKENFYKTVGPLDVVLSVKGKYPYTTLFQFRSGAEVGRIVGSFEHGKRYPVLENYFLQDQYIK